MTLRSTPTHDPNGEEEEGDDEGANANLALRHHLEESIFGDEYKVIYQEAVGANNVLREEIREINTRRDAEVRRVNEIANSEIHYKEVQHVPIRKRKMDELVAIVNKVARYEARKEMDAEKARLITSKDGGEGRNIGQEYEERLKRQSKEQEDKLTDLQATFDLIIKTQEEEHGMALAAAHEQQQVEHESKIKAMLENFEKREAEHKAVLEKSAQVPEQSQVEDDGNVQRRVDPSLEAEFATLRSNLEKEVVEKRRIERVLEEIKMKYETSIIAERQEKENMLQLAVQEIHSYQMKMSEMKIEYDNALKEQRRELEAKMEDAIIKEKRLQMKAMANEMEAIRVAKEEEESQHVTGLVKAVKVPMEDQMTAFDYTAFFKTKRE